MTSMAKKPTAIIYARVSTVRQADDGLPIQSQVEQAMEKAAKLGATVLRTFLDEGLSGRTSRRPAFQDAIAYCATAKINLFIVWNTSRFARNKIDAASYKAVLRRGGTRVVYASGEIDSDTDEGWFSESIFEIVDEHYSRVISRDTKRSMITNARDGFFNGGRVPFGYRVVPSGKRKKLAIEEGEAPLVRDIFRMYQAGAGMKEIAMALNRDCQFKRGQRWDKKSIGLVLKGPVYTGQTVFNRTDHRERMAKSEEHWIRTKSHEGIISEEEFMNVQEIMKRRAPKENNGSPRSRFVFTGLLRCGKCGASMQIESATGRSTSYHYYNCRTAHLGRGCVARRIPAHEFDKWMTEGILNRILTPERITEMMREVYELCGEWCKERERRRDELVASMRAVERKRDNLFEILELHGKNAPNLGDMTLRLRDHKARLEELEAALARLEEENAPDIRIDADQIGEVTGFLRDIIATTEDPVKLRTFFSGFIDRIVLESDSVRVEYAPEKILMNQTGAGAVHSERSWLPDLGLLRTVATVIELSDRFLRAA